MERIDYVPSAEWADRLASALNELIKACHHDRGASSYLTNEANVAHDVLSQYRQRPRP